MSEVTTRGWTRLPLGELAEYVNGFGFAPDQWTDVGLPIVRIENMRDADATANRYSGILPERYRVDDGDLLLSWSATLMVLVWDRGPAWLNQHIFKVVPRSGVDRNYLHHLLSATLDDLAGQSHGTTMKHIKRSDLLLFVVAVASVVDQRYIADVLDTVDKAIQSTERLVAKLERIAEGLLAELLTAGIDSSGRLRDPVWQPRQFTQTSLGMLPSTWAVVECKDATSAPIGYGIVQAGEYVADGVCVLMIRDLGGDFRTGLHRTSSSIDAAYARSRVEPGDVLLSVKATIGRTGVVPEWYRGNISRDIARLRPAPSCRPEFLRMLFSSRLGHRLLAQAVVGTTRAEVSIGVLRKVLIPLPPLDEQDRMIEAVDSLDRALGAQREALAKLGLVKRGLIDDLLTGRVGVGADSEDGT